MAYALSHPEWWPGTWVRAIARALWLLQVTILLAAVFLAGLSVVYYYEDRGTYRQVVEFLEANAEYIIPLLVLTALRPGGIPRTAQLGVKVVF